LHAGPPCRGGGPARSSAGDPTGGSVAAADRGRLGPRARSRGERGGPNASGEPARREWETWRVSSPTSCVWARRSTIGRVCDI
jgi:hypothetical protein